MLAAVDGDRLDMPLEWKRQLKELRGQPVRLEFQLKCARLFAIDVR